MESASFPGSCRGGSTTSPPSIINTRSQIGASYRIFGGSGKNKTYAPWGEGGGLGMLPLEHVLRLLLGPKKCQKLTTDKLQNSGGEGGGTSAPPPSHPYETLQCIIHCVLPCSSVKDRVSYSELAILSPPTDWRDTVSGSSGGRGVGTAEEPLT